MAANHPHILILTLEFRGILEHDELYERRTALHECLESVAHVTIASTALETFLYLDVITPKAIIVTTDAITRDEFSHVLEESLRPYVLRGGRLIVALAFTRWLTTDYTGESSIFNKFFGIGLGLKWREGDYMELQNEFNPACVLPFDVDGGRRLWATALHAPPGLGIKKVLGVKNAEEHEKICKPAVGVFTQAQVDEMEAAVVGTKYGDGFVGYVGDCNLGDETVFLIPALCGL